VHVPIGAAIMAGSHYGQTEDVSRGGTITREEVQTRFNLLRKSQGDLAAQMNKASGQIEEASWWMNRIERDGYRGRTV
jgi:hypothetical protein